MGEHERKNRGTVADRAAVSQEHADHGQRGSLGLGHGTPHDVYRRPPAVDPMAPVPDGPGRHVWVLDGDGRLPGLLVEWRCIENPYAPAWQARVTYLLPRGPGWVRVEAWLPAERIQQV